MLYRLFLCRIGLRVHGSKGFDSTGHSNLQLLHLGRFAEVYGYSTCSKLQSQVVRVLEVWVVAAPCNVDV